jgi:tetratricopeptide (TPR) repeat protein
VRAQPAPPPPDADLNTLYRVGVVAKAEGDLERAAALWQQVLDRDPGFGNKTLATFMEQIQQQLLPRRVQRLKELALQARNVGEWGQEIGAWQALLGLEPKNAEAQQAISIAEVNLQHAWMYENAIEFAQQGQSAPAYEQLKMLWQVAPDYGDPAKIAEKPGISLPRLKKSYGGKLVDTAGSPRKIVFSSITQSLNLVKGDYGFESSTPIKFEGTINGNGDFVFIPVASGLKFVGKVQSDGHLAGKWDNLDSPTDHGTWEAT